MSVTREQVVGEARSWLGTPYHHQARVKGAGVDCLGIVGEVGARLGLQGCQEWLTSDEFRTYGRTPRPDLLIARCAQLLERVELAAVGLGDILLMAFKVFPQHFAIVSRLDPVYVIHAYPTVGCVVENGVSVANARVIRAYRYRGVAP